MQIRFRFFPTDPTSDILTFEQVIQNAGAYGEGGNAPVICVEDDLSVYSLVDNGGGEIIGDLVTDPAQFQGRMFRRLSGQVETQHEFVS